MKRFILLIWACIIAAAAHAQAVTSEIIMNSQDPDTGLRAIGTNSVTIRNGFTDRHPLQVGLLALETSEGWIYTLNVTLTEASSRALPEGGLLMLKTPAGDVIEMTNVLDALTSQDFVGRLVDGTTTWVYDNKGGYETDLEQLVAIGRAGVHKIRVQTQGGYFDTEYKKEQWSKVISAHVKTLQGAIRQNKDIRSDF